MRLRIDIMYALTHSLLIATGHTESTMSKPSPTTWTEAIAACAVCLALGFCLAGGSQGVAP